MDREKLIAILNQTIQYLQSKDESELNFSKGHIKFRKYSTLSEADASLKAIDVMVTF